MCTYRQLQLPLRHLGRHISLAEGDGQLQVLLFLSPQPRQPLLLRFLTLPLGPGQLLLLIAKLQRKIDWTVREGPEREWRALGRYNQRPMQGPDFTPCKDHGASDLSCLLKGQAPILTQERQLGW